MEFYVTMPPGVRQNLGDEAADALASEINRVLENLAVKIANETRDRLMPEIHLAIGAAVTQIASHVDEAARRTEQRMDGQFSTVDLKLDAHRAHYDGKVGSALDRMRDQVNESRLGHLGQFYKLVAGSAIFLIAVAVIAKLFFKL